MAPRSIALTEEQDHLVDALVRSGRYRDADEVLREELRLVADHAALGEAFRKALTEGAEAIARGDYETFASVDDLVGFLDRLGDDVIAGRVEP